MRVLKQSVMVLALLAGDGPALAGSAEQADIEAGCRKSTNWTDQACKCVATRAASLSGTQQAFLAATLQQDKATASGLLAQMTQAQMMEAAMFMTTAGPGCQGG
jgi:hypothetical protein